MTFWTRTALIFYLAAWSTAVAYFAFRLLYAIYPLTDRGDLAKLPNQVPILVFLVALWFVLMRARREQFVSASFLASYVLVTPVLIYLAILTLVSWLAGGLGPFIFVIWFFLGLPALLVGMAIHAFGIFPLYFFNRPIFGR